MNRDYWPTQAWRAADPAAVRLRPELLSDLERVIQARYRGINAFLIVRGGYLAFERYFGRCGQEDAHLVASVTKSFISALIGIAIDRGHIQGINQHVLDFFSEFHPGPRDGLKRRLTIEHLLTMTAGFQWRTGARAHELMLDRMRRSEDWVRFILELPIRERSFGSFQYNSGASHLLSAILTQSTGQSAQGFAAEHLFEPIGIDQAAATEVQHTSSQADVFRNRSGGWPQDPQGNSIGGWGLLLKPRDMARFGFLYLSGGQWDGKQVVPKKWVEDSISAHTPGYGYQWWLRDVNGLLAFSAAGQGGQHIFGIPSLDLLVVVTSKLGSRWRDRWPLLEEHVIPAVTR